MEQTVETESPALAAAVATPTTNGNGKTEKNLKSYPPISSIPRTSRARLDATCTPDMPTTHIPAAKFSVESTPDDDAAGTNTVLYLAYGSNMCAQTFSGMRGIRPLSRVNVSAPSLRLVFNLPGMPYMEPCFANSAPRKLPKMPGGGGGLPLPIPEIPPRGTAANHYEPNQHGDPVWDKGLIGVVYEVTREDYAKILASEGGGSGYQDVLVPCLELPPSVSVPEKPSPVPELPKPFLAHTLFDPGSNLPDQDKTETTRDSDDDQPQKPKLPWYARFLRTRPRPDPDYAQPSPRYLNLLREGARENDLPTDYQEWLGALQGYVLTTTRQRVCQWLLKLTLYPVVMLSFMVGRVFADGSGIHPLWLRVWMGMFFGSVWKIYDAVLKPVFGDGERTMVAEKTRRGSLSFHKEPATDEEKRELLKDAR